VADELTKLKSFRLRQGSKRARALGRVAHTKVDRFIGLTGTPAANGIKDLWGQMWFMDQGTRLGKTFSAFEQRWFRKGYDGYSLVPYDHSQTEIEGLLADVCLTVRGLPVDEPIVSPVMVDLPVKARAVYADMEKDMFAEIAEQGVEAANAAVRTQKLLQLANGAIYLEDGSWEEVHEAKLDALGSVIAEANGASVLVAYNFKHDMKRLRKRFPKARVLDADPKTIDDWNAGKIEILLAHPACLTPRTEVLTEKRGWVSIVDVMLHERVHDGVEFVQHRGCSFSGVKHVISVFGIGMTPDHKLLIDGKWVEASHVRDTGRTAGEACYAYSGNDRRLRALFELRGGTAAPIAERNKVQQTAPQTLQALPSGHFPHDDRDAFLEDMEGHGKPRYQSKKQGFPSVWRGWAGCVRCVVGVRELLSRHVRGVHGRPNNRQNGQLVGLFPRELPLGAEPSAASQQGEQSRHPIRGARNALGGVLPNCGHQQGRGIPKAELRYDGRRGGVGLQELSVQEKPEISPVYDLVDCGPRNRFLIRNAMGEVFVSHNSAGHGLNLAEGGNILAFYGVNWNLEEHQQIIERIGPMRQKQAGLDRPVLVYPILASGTVDEMVMERLQTKRSVQEILLKAMEKRT